MRRIILLLIVICSVGWSANRVWDGSTNNKWSDTTNWSGGAVPTSADSAIFNNSADVACSLDVNVSVLALKIAANYTATWKAGGRTITVSTGINDSGTGAHIWADSIYMSGNGSVKISAGVATPTASSTVLAFGGTDTLSNFKSTLAIKRLRAFNSSKVTFNGSQSFTCQDNYPVIVGNDVAMNATAAGIPRINMSGAGRSFTWGTNSTFDNSANCQLEIYHNANNSLDSFSFPNSWSGTAGFFLGVNSNYTGCKTILIGSIACAGTFVYRGSGSGSLTLDLNGYNLTMGTCSFGTNSVTGGTMIIKWGSGTHTMTSYSGSTYNGTGGTTDSMQSAKFLCSGNWTNGSNHTMVPGTSKVILTANSTVTSAGKSFYEMRDSLGTLTFADAPSFLGPFTALSSSGNLSWSGYTMTCASDFTNNTAGATNYGNGITMTGASATLSITSAGTPTTTSAVFTFNGSNQTWSHNFNTRQIKQVVVGNSAQVTSTMSGYFNCVNAGPCLVIGTNASATFNHTAIFKSTTPGDVYQIGSGSTLSGSGITTFEGSSGGTYNYPAMNYVGTGFVYLRHDNANTGSSTANVTGNITGGGLGELRIYRGTNTGTFTFSQGTYAITGWRKLNFGSAATGTLAATFNGIIQADTITTTGFTSGTTTANFTGATITSKTVVLAAGHNYTMAAAPWRFYGTGTATTAGKKLWDVRKVDSGRTTLGDSLQCAYLYDSAGVMTLGYNTYVDSNYVNVSTSADTSFMGANILVGKDVYRGAGSFVKRTAGQLILDTTKTEHSFTSNGSIICCLYANYVQFQPRTYLLRVKFSDSAVITFKSGAGARIDTLERTGGSSGKLIQWIASSAGNVARVWVDAYVATYSYFKDIFSKKAIIDARNANNEDGGNNFGIAFVQCFVSFSYDDETPIFVTGTEDSIVATPVACDPDSFIIVGTPLPSGLTLNKTSGSIVYNGLGGAQLPTIYTVRGYDNAKTDSADVVLSIRINSSTKTVYCHPNGTAASAVDAYGPFTDLAHCITLRALHDESLDVGDTVSFAPGLEFKDSLLIKWEGSSGKPIVFLGNGATLSGANGRGGWTSLGNNTYRTHWGSTAPNFCWFGNEKLTKKSALPLSDHYWYFHGDSIYIMDKSTNPDTNGFEASRRDFLIQSGSSHSYITIRGLNIIKSNNYGVDYYGGAVLFDSVICKDVGLALNLNVNTGGMRFNRCLFKNAWTIGNGYNIIGNDSLNFTYCAFTNYGNTNYFVMDAGIPVTLTNCTVYGSYQYFINAVSGVVKLYNCITAAMSLDGGAGPIVKGAGATINTYSCLLSRGSYNAYDTNIVTGDSAAIKVIDPFFVRTRSQARIVTINALYDNFDSTWAWVKSGRCNGIPITYGQNWPYGKDATYWAKRDSFCNIFEGALINHGAMHQIISGIDTAFYIKYTGAGATASVSVDTTAKTLVLKVNGSPVKTLDLTYWVPPYLTTQDLADSIETVADFTTSYSGLQGLASGTYEPLIGKTILKGVSDEDCKTPTAGYGVRYDKAKFFKQESGLPRDTINAHIAPSTCEGYFWPFGYQDQSSRYWIKQYGHRYSYLSNTFQWQYPDSFHVFDNYTTSFPISQIDTTNAGTRAASIYAGWQRNAFLGGTWGWFDHNFSDKESHWTTYFALAKLCRDSGVYNFANAQTASKWLLDTVGVDLDSGYTYRLAITPNENMNLKQGLSPAIGKGRTDVLTGRANQYDLNGRRITDASGNLVVPSVGMGAYQYPDTIARIYGTRSKTGTSIKMPCSTHTRIAGDSAKMVLQVKIGGSWISRDSSAWYTTPTKTTLTAGGLDPLTAYELRLVGKTSSKYGYWHDTSLVTDTTTKKTSGNRNGGWGMWTKWNFSW